jgi:hypothetical protein
MTSIVELEITKTLYVPVTKRKLSILNSLTAKFTFCVSLLSNLIEKPKMNVSSYVEFTKQDIAQIKLETRPGLICPVVRLICKRCNTHIDFDSEVTET